MRMTHIFMLLALSVGGAFAASMNVQVKTAKVRATPSQLGRIVASVPYGDSVEAGVLSRGWYAVTLADGRTGWLHQSALSNKRITMTAGTTDVNTGVSQDEVSLAGKGFNEEVEAKFKQDTALDFTWVDRMIDFKVSEDQIRAFRAQGHLQEGGAL